MDNPYASPSSNLRGADTYSVDSGVSLRVAEIMRRTAPWTRVVGVTTFINVAITVISIFQAAGGDSYTTGKLVGGNFLSIVIQLYLAGKLMGYSRNIARMLQSGASADLQAALGEHRKYWKTFGVLMLIVVIFGFIGLFAAIGAGSGRYR